MKRIFLAAVLVSLFTLTAQAQEHYTLGPVWRVTLIHVKGAGMDAYLTSLRQSTKTIFDEEKKQGTIVDYKVFLKSTKTNPNDWDIAVAVEYKDWAAIDAETAKAESVRDKVLGGKQQAQSVADKRLDIREIVSTDLMQEIFLK